MSEQTIEQPHKIGRPTVMTPGTVDKLTAAFQRGFSISTACKIAGIHRDTYYKWLDESPDFSDRMEGAQEYAKILAGDTIIDVLQDIHRGKKDEKTGQVISRKYSEQTRATISKWFLEKTEKEVFGSQSMIAAKTETNDKGGMTTTIIYATDGIITQFAEKGGVDSGSEEDDPGQLLEVLEDSPQEEGVVGGSAEGSAPPVHPEELQGEHPPEEGVPQP